MNRISLEPHRLEDSKARISLHFWRSYRTLLHQVFALQTHSSCFKCGLLSWVALVVSLGRIYRARNIVRSHLLRRYHTHSRCLLLIRRVQRWPYWMLPASHFVNNHIVVHHGSLGLLLWRNFPLWKHTRVARIVHKWAWLSSCLSKLMLEFFKAF